MNRWKMTLAAVIGVLLIVGVGAVARAQENEFTPTPTAQPLQDDFVFVVRPGDVLDVIGAFYDVDTACLIEQNELPQSGVIFPGDEILISAACPRYTGESEVINPRREANIAAGQYIVGRGDVLDLIAAVFNLDLACLLERNEIDNVLLLRAGQLIVLPADCPPYAGLSTPRPGQIHGLLSRTSGGTSTLRAPATPRPTSTPAPSQPPTLLPPTLTPPPQSAPTATAAG